MFEMMFALMFALARMASAAWVGAAVLFVLVAVDQTNYIKQSPGFFVEKAAAPVAEQLAPAASGTPARAAVPVSEDGKTRLVAQFAERRFRLYYYTGATLLGLAWVSTLFLRRRYLKASRWLLVMVFLTGAAAMMGYDWLKVYQPLQSKNLQIMENPQVADDGEFQALHEHSRMVNSAQLLMSLLGSLFLCLPGTRPEQRTMLIQQSRE